MQTLKIVRNEYGYISWGTNKYCFLFLHFVDYAKYYESLSNNAPMEGMEDEGAGDTMTYETNNTQEHVVETFEESGAEEFEEDEDIPLVSGKLKS